MVKISNNTQGNVNITTRNGAGVNLNSNNDTDVSANMNGNSQRAKSWAVGEGLIDGVDYSAKHYAQEAKESEEIASHAIENIDTAKEQALSAIDDEKTSALNDIDTEKTEAIADMETAKDEKIGEIESLAADFEDDLEALATRAETAATNAETSETNAATSATSASTSATNAAASAETATSAKNDAVSAKNTAAISASIAETYKNQASQARSDAYNYATQARGSANTASSKAEEAKSYSQGAAAASARAEQAKNAAEGYAEQAEAAKDDIEAELDNYVPDTRKVNNKPLSADITLTASDIGALANSTKYGYSIDLSLNTTNYKLTLTLKDQDGTTLNTKTVDFPIESVVVNGSYDSTNKKIVLTLQSGSTIDIPVGDLISGLQTEITSTNKLDADLVDDTTATNKFVTASDKTNWNGKLSVNDLSTELSSGNYQVNFDNLQIQSDFGIYAGNSDGDDLLYSEIYDESSDYVQVTANGFKFNGEDVATQQWATQQANTLYGAIQQWVGNQGYALSSSLATVATSGSYNDLSNKPTIPAAQVQADWNVTDTTSKAYIKNKPTIPSGVVVDQTFDGTSQNAQSGVAIAGAGFLTSITSSNVTTALGYIPANIDYLGVLNERYGFGGRSGQDFSYVINGTEKVIFEAATKTINDDVISSNIARTSQIPTVPTNISAFTNDSGYITGITSSDVITALGYTPSDNTLSNVSSIDSSSAVQTALDGKADTDLSNLSATGKALIDGAFVASESKIIENGTINANTTTSAYSLSSYLPNDNHTYEVFGDITGQTSSTSGQYVTFFVGMSGENAVRAASALTRTNNTMVAAGYFSGFVNSTRTIKVTNSGTSKATGVTLRLLGYRRVGTNA